MLQNDIAIRNSDEGGDPAVASPFSQPDCDPPRPLVARSRPLSSTDP